MRGLLGGGGEMGSVGINDVDYEGRSALHVAAGKGQLTLCKLLLEEFEAAVNLEDEEGSTPLTLAIKRYQKLRAGQQEPGEGA